MLYNPPHFRTEDLAAAQDRIDAQPFAMLVTAGPDGPFVSHLPLLLDRQAGGMGRLVGHVARANPHWKVAAEPQTALAVFSGPNSYVSPSWYPSKTAEGKAVPTWNYRVVQVKGRLSWFNDAEALRDVVTRLTDRFETGRADRWHVTDAPESYVTAMLRGIVGVSIEIEAIEAKDKLSQNRTVEDQDGVIAGLAGEEGAGAAAVAALMKANRGPG